MTPLIDSYLANLEDPWPRQTACAVVGMIRDLGRLDESIKWGQPYFSLDGRAVMKIYTAHEWISIFFYHGAEIADPTELLGREGRSSMRRLQVRRDQAVPDALRDMIHQSLVIAEPGCEPRPLPGGTG